MKNEENSEGEAKARKSGKDEETLIFVYNADSGLFNAFKDYFRKAVSPSTYGCNLCGITFGALGMRKDWKSFIAHLDMPVEFLHRDEFLTHYPSIKAHFPAAFVKRGSDISLLIPHANINKAKSVDDLINLVTEKLQEINQ